MSSTDKMRTPKLDTKNWSLFKLKLNAYLAMKDNADIALSQPRPKIPSPAELIEVKNEEKRKQKLKLAKRQIKAWDTADRIAYYAIIEAVDGNPTANIIVLDVGHKASANALLSALEKRYNINGNNVIQSKLAYFNLLTIKSGENAMQFADRIIESRLELKDMGIDESMISKDLHCLSRLKEGLAGSPIYKDIAMKLMVETNLTWDEAIKSLTILDGSIALREKVQSEAGHLLGHPKSIEATVPTVENVKWLGKPKHGKLTKFCKICKKKGHVAADCWNNKAGSKGLNHNSFKSNHPIVCHRCGKKGHIAPNCRTRRREDTTQSNAYDNFSDGKRPKTNYSSDLKYDLIRMIRNQTNRLNKNDETACLDSGASVHVLSVSTLYNLGCVESEPTKMLLQTAATNSEIEVIGCVSIGLLTDVAIVNDMELMDNIVSIAKLDACGFKTVFGNNEAIIYDKDDNMLFCCKMDASRSYRVPLNILIGHTVEHVKLASAKPMEDGKLIHKRLGHRCMRDLHNGLTNSLFTGQPNFKLERLPLCESCVRAKSSRMSYNRGQMSKIHRGNFVGKPIVPIENTIRKIVTDIKGPFSVPGYNKDKYFQIFTEKDTKFMHVYSMPSKSDALSNLNSLLDELHLLKQSVICYHADGAPELISDSIKKVLQLSGCRLSYSPPYTPQLNGQAERMNQTVWNMAYTLLLDCSIPLDLWPFAVRHAVLLCNMLPTKGNPNSKSPMEVKFGLIPNLCMFRVFGCRAYIHIPEVTRSSTFSDKAYKGYFIGFKSIYELEHIYVFVPELNRVIKSMNVIFDEIEDGIYSFVGLFYTSRSLAICCETCCAIMQYATNKREPKLKVSNGSKVWTHTKFMYVQSIWVSSVHPHTGSDTVIYFFR